MASSKTSTAGFGSWRVLLVVMLNSALNALICMNTSAVEDAFAELFRAKDVSRSDIEATYSYYLLTVLVGMTPGMLLAVRHERVALGFSVACNVTAAWLRWLSVRQVDYTLLLGSVVLNGVGFWTILALPSQISARRFPKHLRTLTTSLAVQANYGGWLLGTGPPALVSDSDSLQALCLWQALAVSPVLLLFLALYESPVPCSDTDEEFLRSLLASPCQADPEKEGSFRQLLAYIIRRPRFALEVFAYNILGGISWAIPSASIFILENFGLNNDASSVVNLVFIGSGIVGGILLGRCCNHQRCFGWVLKTLFLVCSASLWFLSAITKSGAIRGNSQIALLLLSAVAGFTSLGFMGVAIEAAACHPIGSGYACWFVELFTQAVAAALCFWVDDCDGFAKLAAVSSFATLLLMACYRTPKNGDPL